ncbi:trifunctional serine/threonine-protein kinase/ATP-binding protein/sensor histidine kinase [Variovorax saccharolyticus]|uniref:trifunctional serine/threonine-protein kinase/ATP-binding protein/sensor histidine kinase n=1 Tax=Variovorax saccharolyticus TaxID=3053516 RepID=UPI0025754BA4|nr:trifunctional serine/threonine-protein kinase/ATP-binding protein/sensor histidine kinase [Variovorax sp. J31P216]MDM0029080.1 AAA family ATPase [Variovorax sp. J31P216]
MVAAGGGMNRPIQILWQDDERLFCRTWHDDSDGIRQAALAVMPSAEHPTPASIDRLVHEHSLREGLDREWAARPLELVRHGGKTMLLLEPLEASPLELAIGRLSEPGKFLRLAVAMASAIAGMHASGLVHKDIKPSNILVDEINDRVWLTGFGIASQLPRERQAPVPPELIVGTLAYMAPEQTGRMNRSIDSRSDLYALGVTFYRMLTGSLPFTATDPMEWIHCHIARKPIPPRDRLILTGVEIPVPISELVMKLLSKTAEERYQTAVGLESDLRRCAAQWHAAGRIDVFPLGGTDLPGRLVVPEKLYGRTPEIQTLLDCFDVTAKSGKSSLVLVSGPAGIGKSSLASEVHRALLPSRGLFASGKYDQYKQDIPYSTLAQAFRSLVRPMLGKSEAELGPWRSIVLDVVGPHGRIITDLIPELKLIIGEQPPAPELPVHDAQRRLQRLLRRFIGVFSRPEQPLVLFLDDLQWLDIATLDLVEDLLVQQDVRYLLLIGAYRDNEVGPNHPWMQKLEALDAAGTPIHRINLRPLEYGQVSQLIADALRCDEEGVDGLVQLVLEKTDGNPFFVNQFLAALVDEGQIKFDRRRSKWSWELHRIRAMRYTDNVADLMIAKMARLSVESQNALRHLACLGNAATIATLSVVQGIADQAVHLQFREPLRMELVERVENSYRFVHDRIHEAAYALIPSAGRAEFHLRIGRSLVAHTPSEVQEEIVFDIVNQLNRAITLISSHDERDRLAAFNLLAGKRAQAAAAHASARGYLMTSAVLLGDDGWLRRPELLYAVELERAQVDIASGAVAEAEQRLCALSSRVASIAQRAGAACLLVDLYQSMDQNEKALQVGLEVLHLVGIDWSSRPTESEARQAFERIQSQLTGQSVGELINLPLMSDPASLAILDLMIRVAVPGFFASSHLFAVAVCRAVSLGLEQGHSVASPLAYEFLAMLAGPHFGDYDAGYRFGRLGCDLVERAELSQFRARTYTIFGFITPWTRHVRTGREYLVRAFDEANRVGDVTYAAYPRAQLNTNLLFSGDPLADVQREAEQGLAFAQKVKFGMIASWMAGQLGLIRTLRGLTKRFGSFDDASFTEEEFEHRVANDSALALPGCWYWIRKLQASFLAGDYVSALRASAHAEPLLEASMSHLETVEYHFYDALSHAAAFESASTAARTRHMAALLAGHARLDAWADACPDNFFNRAALVEAEIARIQGKELIAERLYERAIESASAGGFIHNEALANELAGRFHADRGFERIANWYLREARQGYLLWGADAKVRQLDQRYLNVKGGKPMRDAGRIIASSVEQLDLATVIKVSEAISGEIVLDKLIDTLMRAALEFAGAERGVLVLPRNNEHRIAAEARMGSDGIDVSLRPAGLTSADLPGSVFQYVLRTRENVLLQDACSEMSEFSNDEFVRFHGTRSLLCLPLLKQKRLLGVLYLENNLVRDVFTSDRMTVLKLLASAAAVSLENAGLYRDVQEREGRVRRLFNSNIIGIFTWNLDGRILDANQAFGRIVGYGDDELTSGQVRWRDLMPASWDEDDDRIMRTLQATTVAPPFEGEYVRKDGTIVPVLIGIAMFDGSPIEGVAFVLDLTDRKKAEQAARDSEQRHRDVELKLLDANRVASISLLSASIAHEINQPLSGIVTNASTGLRMLNAEPPDIDGARETAQRTLRDGNRAADVITRLRTLFRNGDLLLEPMNLNDATREVVAMLSGELERSEVILQLGLADSLPLVTGDRIQLQQVILNLIRNASEAMADVHDRPRRLVIRTDLQGGDHVCVSVEDAGVGLDGQNVERIFDAFYSTKSVGMGVGLSVSRSIIERHGGRLWAEPHDSNGVTFQFSVPVDRPDA